MPYRTDDPERDFERRDREEAEWLASRPLCANCGRPIQDDHYYLIGDEPICPHCLENEFRVEIED